MKRLTTTQRPPSARKNEGILRYFTPLSGNDGNVLAGHAIFAASNASKAEKSPPTKVMQMDKMQAIEAMDESVQASFMEPVGPHASSKKGSVSVSSVPLEVSEYERKRLARVAMNAQMLHELGVHTAQRTVAHALQPSKRTVPKKKRLRDETDSSDGVAMAAMVLGTRRSSRLKGIKLSDTAPTAPIKKDEDEDETKAQDVELSYDESSVLKYMCSQVSATITSRGEERPTGASLIGYRAAADTLMDPTLRKIYSINFSPFHENALIAAGGHQGHVSVYPSPVSTATKEKEVSDEATPPLLSFRAHRGWISSLSLAKSSVNGPPLLLSAANDGVIKLWDLNQSASGVPKEMMCVDDLHRNGIFGMDVSVDVILTCSKDSTIAVSTFRENASGLTVTRRYDDHEGVVKSARFSPLNAFCIASGGNDKCIRIYDTRSSTDRSSHAIPDAHARAINSVVWHPIHEHLLLSASFDPAMHLYDLRHSTKPLHILSASTAHTGTAIFHPCFVENGSVVISTGVGSQDQLTLHRTQDGSMISCGQLPGKASSIACDPWSGRLLVAMGPHLQLYDKEWQGP